MEDGKGLLWSDNEQYNNNLEYDDYDNFGDVELQRSEISYEPSPPSVGSASIVIPQALRKRRSALAGHPEWKSTERRKLDATGKPKALWDDSIQGRSASRLDEKSWFIGGIDVHLAVRQLDECWAVPKREPRIASQVVTMLHYCEMNNIDIQPCIESILANYALGSSNGPETFEWRALWKSVDENTKTRANEHAQQYMHTIEALLHLENALEKINKLESDINAAMNISNNNGDETTQTIPGPKRVSEGVAAKTTGDHDPVRIVQLWPAGPETAYLSTDPRIGELIGGLGELASSYMHRLWEALALIRAQVSSTSYSLDAFESKLQAAESAGKDNRIQKQELDSILSLEAPGVSPFQRKLVLTFMDAQLSELIDIQDFIRMVQGTLTHDRMQLVAFLFREKFAERGSRWVKKLATRRGRIQIFYEQFCPQEDATAKAAQLDLKYKDNPTTNQELFERLYGKYASWLNPPEYNWDMEALQQEIDRIKNEQFNISWIEAMETYLNEAGLASQLKQQIRNAITQLRKAKEEADFNSPPSWAEFQMFLAQVSALIPSDDIIFDHLVCNLMDVPLDDWHAARELLMKISNANVEERYQRARERETEKVENLRKSLDLAVFDHYMSQLGEVIRRVHNALLGTGTSKINQRKLVKMFEDLDSFDSDRTISYDDLEHGLAGKLGVRLSKDSWQIICLHFDSTNTQRFEVDAFVCSLLQYEDNREHRARAAIEIQSAGDLSRIRKRWIKSVRTYAVPEPLKKWTKHVGSQDGIEKPFWFCELTGERSWNQPLVCRIQAREESNAAREEHVHVALSKLAQYRDMVYTLRDQHLGALGNINQVLCLAESRLSRFPKAREMQTSCENLKVAYLAANNLRAIPSSVFFARNMEYLIVQDNRIDVAGCQIPQNCSLRRLHTIVLSRNELTRLPDIVSCVQNLRVLDLERNAIDELANEPMSKIQAEVLYLNHNKIIRLPDHAQSWQGLRPSCKFLNLGNNLIRIIPKQMISMPFTKLTCLCLKKNSLETLPEMFGTAFPKVQKLELQGNNLTVLPESIGVMRELSTLYLDRNAIAELPDVFGALTSLTELRVNNNRLQTFPTSMGQLKNLRVLHVQGNRIVELPKVIETMDNLKVLWLHQNRIRSIEIGFPTGLIELKLQNNQIQTIGEAMCKNCAMEHLDLGGNMLVSLPTALYRMKNVKYLRLDDNPMEPVLAKIVKSGFFETQEEESFGRMLRKLVDSVRQEGVQARVNGALGISIQQALEIEREQRIDEIQRKKDIKLGAVVSSKTPIPEKGRPNKSLSLVQQSLMNMLAQFSKHSGEDGTRLSRKTFRTAMQVIGNLLSPQEVDRLAARTVIVFDPQETGFIEFEAFVESINVVGASKSQPSTMYATDPIAAKYGRVAHAVLRFYAAKRAAQAHETLKKITRKHNAVKTPSKPLEKREDTEKTPTPAKPNRSNQRARSVQQNPSTPKGKKRETTRSLSTKSSSTEKKQSGLPQVVAATTPSSNSAGPQEVWIDFEAASAPFSIKLHSLAEVVDSIKSKIEFQELIPKDLQVLVYNGRKLNGTQSLSEQRVPAGSTLKLLIVPIK